METIWNPVRESGTLTERIVSRIEELIDHDELKQGEKLPAERELARLLGVSRPALREAMKTLEAHQRLVVKHGQGVFVGIDKQDLIRQRLTNFKISLEELFAMRNVLESPAARWAASYATDEDISILEVALKKEEEARTPPIDFVTLGNLDAAFHLTIVEIAKNRFLLQTLGVLQEMMAEGMETTLKLPGRLEQSRHEHRAIFEAIREHDFEAAGSAASSHILGAKEAALDRLEHELDKKQIDVKETDGKTTS